MSGVFGGDLDSPSGISPVTTTHTVFEAMHSNARLLSHFLKGSQTSVTLRERRVEKAL